MAGINHDRNEGTTKESSSSSLLEEDEESKKGQCEPVVVTASIPLCDASMIWAYVLPPC